jgi:predicted RNase H-like HicB family nuclease
VVLTRDEYLRIPYVLVVESVAGPDGDWCRRASYPELPGVVAEAESAVEAMDEADEKRRRVILDWLDAGIPVPVPRDPL